MSFLRDRARNVFKQRDDSFIIYDSDEEIHSSLKTKSIPNTRIIQDTDSESESYESGSTNTNSHEINRELLTSDEEDVQFINKSQKVSIISSSDSECDLRNDRNKKIKKLNRFSIYENSISSQSSENESSPIHGRFHQRTRKKNMDFDSDSEDSENISVGCDQISIRQSLKNELLNDNTDNNLEKDTKTNFDKHNIESQNKQAKINQRLNTPLNYANEKLIDVKHEKSYDDDSLKEISVCNNDHEESEIEISDSSPINNNSKMKNFFVKEASLKDDDKIIVSVNDSIEEDFNNEQNSIDKEMMNSTSSSASDSEIDKEVIRLAKKEIKDGTDPIDAQKKEHLVLNISFVEKQLDKLNKFAESVDIHRLPDKGAKVYEAINQYEEKLWRLKDKLKAINRRSFTSNKKIQIPRNTEIINRKPITEELQNSKILEKQKSNIKAQKFDQNQRLNGGNVTVHVNVEDDEINKVNTSHNSKLSNDFDVREIPNLPKASFNTNGFGTKALETLNREQELTQQRLVQLHGSLTSRPPMHKKVEDPFGLTVSLMPHQQQALTWIKWREKQKPRGGILADDMGLGKTLTMIALVLATVNDEKKNYSDESSSSSDDGWLSRHKHKRYYGGTLVVCPASLINQWEAEIKKRCKRGLLSTLVFHGNNRNIDNKKLSNYNVVITTYQVLVREADAQTKMYRMEWNRVIVDEAHYIRNHKSKASLALCGVHAKHRWALTGTPIQNKEMDLFAILKFLQCTPFDNLQVWKRWVDNKNDAGKQRLITIMKTLMLRRTKEELQSKGSLQSLPDKNLKIIEIELDRDENLVYQKMLFFSQTLFAQFLHQRAEKQHMRELHGGNFDRSLNAFNAAKTQFTKAQQVLLKHHSNIEAHEILVLLLRLRQMCCHPALIHSMLDKHDAEMNGLDTEEDNTEDLIHKLHNMSVNEDENVEEHVANYKIDDRVAMNLLTKKNPVFNDNRCSSKIRVVIKTIEEIVRKGDKLIVVSQWTSFLKVVAKNLDNIKMAKYLMFTGSVIVKDRQGIVDKVNDPNGDVNILLLSLTAGGVGLNLVGANHLLLIDIHWNPQLEAQAQDRIYRFGQHKNVYIYKFICKDTIEERIKSLQDKKLELANHILSGTKSLSSKLTIEDLKSLFS